MDNGTSDGIGVDVSEWDAYLYFRDRIADILDPRLYPLEWLDTQVFIGNARVFWEDESCALTEVKIYPTGFREIHGLLAVGDVETITKVLIPRAEAFGKQYGCGLASIASRPGWAKVLPDYKVYQVTLRKDI